MAPRGSNINQPFITITKCHSYHSQPLLIAIHNHSYPLLRIIQPLNAIESKTIIGLPAVLIRPKFSDLGEWSTDLSAAAVVQVIKEAEDHGLPVTWK